MARVNLPITYCQNISFSTIEIFLKKSISNSFNEYLVNVGPKLTHEIHQSQNHLRCISESSFEEVTLSDEEIKTAFLLSLKSGKSPWFNEVNYDAVKQLIISLLVRRLHRFLVWWHFIKSGDTSLMTNYGTISVLPFFSKIFERIKYYRLYTCLTENNLLYWKQLLFQNDHSPEYAGLQVSSRSWPSKSIFSKERIYS